MKLSLSTLLSFLFLGTVTWASEPVTGLYKGRMGNNIVTVALSESQGHINGSFSIRDIERGSENNYGTLHGSYSKAAIIGTWKDNPSAFRSAPDQHTGPFVLNLAITSKGIILHGDLVYVGTERPRMMWILAKVPACVDELLDSGQNFPEVQL